MENDDGALAFQCQLEYQQYELMELEEEYKFFIQEEKYESRNSETI